MRRSGAGVWMRSGAAWVAIAALVVPPTSAQAQRADVPAAARPGVEVPAAYYRRIAADPTAFTLPNGLFAEGSEGRRASVAVSGTKRIAVIPALFADSPEPHVTREMMRQRIFDGPAPRGTLTGAYLEFSGGRLTVTGEVAPWVRTELTRAEVVGSDRGLGEDARVGDFLLDALAKVDADFDFGQYDNDGPDGQPNSGDDNGWVDAIAFQFIEVAASCGGPGIWPHLWGIRPQNEGRPYVTDDVRPDGSFVSIDAYIIQSAVDCSGQEPQDANVIAHEFGHVLGLPDYYHPVDRDAGSFGRRWVLGCWELMAAGAWGCGPHSEDRAPFGPTHLSARSKNALDWLTYVDVPADGVLGETYTLRPVQESEQALRIPLDGTGREFLVVEYRTRDGFDAVLPAEGLLVYHMDLEGKLRPEPAQSYFMSVVERDADAGLMRTALEGGDRGEAGDAWAREGGVDELHLLTTPSLRLHAGGGAPTRTVIHSMKVADGVAEIRLTNNASPVVVSPPEPLRVAPAQPFEERILVGGGAMPYTLEAATPPGVTATLAGDEVVLSGTLPGPGPFEVALRVTDAALSRSGRLFVPISASEFLVGEERLTQPFLRSGAEPLTAGERTYLDFVGNRNGRYDVGDLRSWLRSR